MTMTPQSDCVKPFTLSELESHLWEAANILRGPVDAADFKTYVFPLLFSKSLSDTYDEEYQTALKESGGDVEFAQFSQNYRFKIPDYARWKDVRTVTSNIGQALQKAMRSIEKANSNTLGEKKLDIVLADWLESSRILREALAAIMKDES